MTLTLTEIRELLAAHGRAAVAKRSARTFSPIPTPRGASCGWRTSKPGDRVVEVGPGVGSLTVALADAGAHVLAIEIDRHLVPVLREVVGDRDVEIVHADALARRLAGALLGAGPWTMVANLPYNVATPVVMRALETAPMIERFLVMVQREVGERFAARVGDDAYGAVSVKVAWYASARGSSGMVPPTVFFPKPNVDSALVSNWCGIASPPVAVRDPERMFALVQRRVRDAPQDAARHARGLGRRPRRSRPPAIDPSRAGRDARRSPTGRG